MNCCVRVGICAFDLYYLFFWTKGLVVHMGFGVYMFTTVTVIHVSIVFKCFVDTSPSWYPTIIVELVVYFLM